MEQKNLVRQDFIPADLGENKARVLAERYSTVFGMETEYVPAFIESAERLKDLIAPRVTYFLSPFDAYSYPYLRPPVLLWYKRGAASIQPFGCFETAPSFLFCRICCHAVNLDDLFCVGRQLRHCQIVGSCQTSVHVSFGRWPVYSWKLEASMTS